MIIDSSEPGLGRDAQLLRETQRCDVDIRLDRLLLTGPQQSDALDATIQQVGQQHAIDRHRGEPAGTRMPTG